VRVLRGHSDPVLALTLSRDGRTLASGSYDHNVKLWDVKTGNEIRTLAYKKMEGVTEQVRSVSLSSDGKVVASRTLATTSGSSFQ
jgi:WD40 repeat protein